MGGSFVAGTTALSTGRAGGSWGALAGPPMRSLYAALKQTIRSADNPLMRKRQPSQPTPPLGYRLVRWREERLATLMGWLAAISVLLAAGFVVGSF